MKKVFLTSGPRGSGKSMYVKEVKERYPEIIVISRDEILLSLFGETSLNPYEGGHMYVLDVLFKELKKHLSLNSPNQKILLDCWNGFSYERKEMIQRLRDFGAEQVFGLYFVTPIDICVKWFMSKPDSKGYDKDSIRRDYKLYHEQAKTIKEDGFDKVYKINPSRGINSFLNLCL